jgi:hypothetical protein
MSNSKRKFSDYTTGGADGRGPSESRQHTHKRPKSKHGHRSGDLEQLKNLNQLKKRTRNIERLFKKAENLPANKRIDLERELAHYKQKIVEVEDDKKTKKMISKYHMVRFFGMSRCSTLYPACHGTPTNSFRAERKKADRLAKQIQKRIEQCEDPEETKQLKNDLHFAEIDSIYAKFFPYREAYISLYPVATKDKSAEEGEKTDSASSAAKALRAERPPIWHDIEKASRKGMSALIKIRDRKSSKIGPSKASGANSTALNSGEGVSNPKNAKVKQVIEVAEPEDSDNESDGGFFEAA